MGGSLPTPGTAALGTVRTAWSLGNAHQSREWVRIGWPEPTEQCVQAEARSQPVRLGKRH